MFTVIGNYKSPGTSLAAWDNIPEGCQNTAHNVIGNFKIGVQDSIKTPECVFGEEACLQTDDEAMYNIRQYTNRSCVLKQTNV